MSLSLFSTGVPSGLGIITSSCATFLILRLFGRKHYKLYAYALLGGLLATLILIVTLQNLFSRDKLLTTLWLMLLPFPLAAALAIVTLIRTRRLRKRKTTYLAVSVALLVSSLGFSLSLINQGYHYFPTIASVFGWQSRQQALSAYQATTITYSTLPLGPAITIEGALYDAQKSSYQGRVSRVSIPGTVSGFNARQAWVYTPAIAGSPANVDMPVVVLTSGVPGNPNDWLNGGELVTTLDQFAALHHGITPYVFVVDSTGSTFNDTECVDSSRGNIETYLTRDVPAYIKANYSVASSSQKWGLGGLSMGGMCAVMLTLRHPNVYKTFMDFGGERGPEDGSKTYTIATLFHDSEHEWQMHQPLSLLQRNPDTGVKGFFAAAKEDNPIVLNETRELYQASLAAHLGVVFETLGGQHTFNVWAQALKDALPWLSNQLGATECSGRCI